ncbi:MAG: AAA family ATPase [Caldilineaceae bacterium]
MSSLTASNIGIESVKRRNFLDSLEIQHYRAFQHLKIDHLGRVNLIVGRNSVGKSCLIEAVRLFSEAGSPSLLRQLLEARDEISNYNARNFRGRNYESDSDLFLLVKNLFYGRRNLFDNPEPIRIGSFNNLEQVLTIAVSWFIEELGEDRLRRLKRLDEPVIIRQQSLLDLVSESIDIPIPGLTFQIGNTIENSLPLRRIFDSRFPDSFKPHHIYIPAHGLDMIKISQLWDDITLTKLENDVRQSLKIIIPDVEGINVVGSAERARERTAIVKLLHVDEPVPMRSLGEGLNRAFGIALALVNAQNKILVIDEIESGLHYSVQLELWKLIFEVAHRLNIQVFTTTHSWDCVEAFQQAATQNEAEEGVLIRLQRKNDTIVPTIFDEKKLTIATREQIEIR